MENNEMENNKPAGRDDSEVASAVKKDKFLPVSILVAALVIGGSILFATLYHPAAAPAGAGNGAGNNAGNGGAAQPSATLTPAQVMALGSRDAILGSPSASVTMIEYGDYQCPYCGLYFSQTEPQIVQNYVNTGKVKMVFRNFPFLGAESTAAAEAAECATDQNKLWAYHDALYQAKVNDVAKGGSEDDGFFTRTLFLSLATKLNLDLPTFTKCIDTNAESSTVAADVANTAAAGINSTPVFFINGTEIIGANPYATFQSALNRALQG